MRIVFWDCLVASEFAGVLYLLQHQSIITAYVVRTGRAPCQDAKL